MCRGDAGNTSVQVCMLPSTGLVRLGEPMQLGQPKTDPANLACCCHTVSPPSADHPVPQTLAAGSAVESPDDRWDRTYRVS